MNSEVISKEWIDIVQFYEELIEISDFKYVPLLEMVTKIQTSAYSKSLFAFTSHSTLYIAQSEISLNNQPRLKVEYNPKKEEFHFTYELGYIKSNWWQKTVSSKEGFTTLERFLIKRVRWFKINNDK